jgi:hypothetical protein
MKKELKMFFTILVILILFVLVLLLSECKLEPNPPEPVGKWSGLGMMLFNTGTTAEFDGDVDTLLANGFSQLRISSDWYNWNEDTALKSAIISAIAKGAQVTWVVQSGGRTLTSSNWSDYVDSILAAAQWAQDNGVYEFQIGNEEEIHNDDTTLTDAQLITNLKALATDVQEIFTRGNVSYAAYTDFITDWVTAGRGDIDLIASNMYANGSWKYWTDYLLANFGVDHTYFSEFGLDAFDIDNYSTDEAVQAAGVTGMIDYIKASGMTRAFWFCYKDPPWLSGFGARKDDGTYRLLWNQALLNTGSVKSITIPAKTATISLPDTIALIPK